MDLAQHARLVADVQQRLLTQHGLEAAVGEGQGAGVTADDLDLRVQADQAREAGGAGRPSGVELHRDHAAAAPAGHEASRTAEPGAEIEHPRAGVDAGQAGEGVHRGEAAVVVLVELEQIVGRERGPGERATPPA
jgi:hypothetical protein